MNRRTVLKVGGMAALGAGLGGCAARQPARPVRPPVSLAPVNVSSTRIIRTTVGLRPHRPSGFVLRAEKLDAKTVIHNYGHGGAGMSLSWGCGQRAAEMALEATSAGEKRRAAVVGCGALGLAAARQLQRRGFDVTIYAASVPPDTTSNMSLAGFTPTSAVISFDRRTPQWDAQFRDVVEIAYRQLQLLVGRGYGVSWLYNYYPTDDPRIASGENTLMPANLEPADEVLGPGEHPLPAKYAVRFPGMRIEPSIYLDAMMRDVALFGGRVVIRKLDGPRDVLSIDDPVIVNCTGLGARDLFGDMELVPLKGQLTVLVPQPEVDYATLGAGRISLQMPSAGLHMMPRADGIALGGTRERDVWTLEPNQEELTRMVEGHRRFFEAFTSSSSRTARSAAGTR